MTNKFTLRLAALLSVAVLGTAATFAETTSKKAIKANDMAQGIAAASSLSATAATQNNYNKDNRVSVGDITYFLENSLEVKPGTGDAIAEAPMRAAAVVGPNVAGKLAQNKVSVSLAEAKNFVAFQMDIVVGSSASATAASAEIATALKTAGYQMASNYISASKTLRVLAYHLANKVYNGAAGEDLFSATFTSSGALEASNLTFNNVLFVLEGDVNHDVQGDGTISESGVKKGDINRDGKINSADIMALIEIMLNQYKNYDLDAADINGDGKYNSVDIVALIGLM